MSDWQMNGKGTRRTCINRSEYQGKGFADVFPRVWFCFTERTGWRFEQARSSRKTLESQRGHGTLHPNHWLRSAAELGWVILNEAFSANPHDSYIELTEGDKKFQSFASTSKIDIDGDDVALRNGASRLGIATPRVAGRAASSMPSQRIGGNDAGIVKTVQIEWTEELAPSGSPGAI